MNAEVIGTVVPGKIVRGTFVLLLAAVFFVCAGAPCMGGEKEKKTEADPFFIWDLNWTGSYYNSIKTPGGELPDGESIISGGTFFNRGNLSLLLPSLDLSLRFLATDKRLLPPEENDGKAGFNPGAGFYHHGSGSRFLYGVQNEFGLPARMKNVWLRSAPFIDSRSPSSRDLKIEPSAQDRPESFLLLALPAFYGFSAFASAALDEDLNPAFGGGLGFGSITESFGPIDLRLEGFYTRKTLAQRKISSWFSASPPLPERDFHIYALGMIFTSPNFSFASDWALSETFAWGRGVYANFALRLGHKPWRFSLAGDGAASRFADRSGYASGAGFRLAARVERYWTRSGLLRIQGTIRSPGIKEDFNRGSFSFYFRPSAPSAAEKRNNPWAFRFSRLSIGLNRDARNIEKSADRLEALAAFNFYIFSFSLSGTLNCLSCLDADNRIAPLFQLPLLEDFASFKISGELGLKLYIFDIRTRLAYTFRAEKDSIREPSISITARPGKWGRFGLRFAYTDFPDKWNYTLSWRMDVRSQ